MSLYQIQDSERPMWVRAVSMEEAIRRWRKVIAEENDGDVSDPEGCIMICDDDTELLLEDE